MRSKVRADLCSDGSVMPIRRAASSNETLPEMAIRLRIWGVGDFSFERCNAAAVGERRPNDRLAERLPHLRQHACDARQENRACRSHITAGPASVEEGGPDLALEVTNGQRDTGLRQMNSFCGSADALLRGHGFENAELLQ